MNNTYEECIQAYLDCIKACNYDACINKEDVKMMVPCIRTSRFLEVSLIPQQVSYLLFLKMTRFL